jgi:CheY-like chemotaxis protein
VARILLIDDDRELIAMLAEYLQGEGFEVTSAYSGEQGLELLVQQRYDAVVLDVMMPGRDGLAVLREMRRSDTTPVLMLTARGDDVDTVVGLELGADDYLPKPCNPRVLVARLRAVSINTGVSDVFRSSRSTSKPSRPGSITSRISASSGSPAARARPSSPRCATATTKPSPPRYSASICASSVSSSTSNTFAIGILLQMPGNAPPALTNPYKPPTQADAPAR